MYDIYMYIYIINIYKVYKYIYIIYIYIYIYKMCYYIGERLNDFKILIGNYFIMGLTEAADIGSWSECAHVTGR